VKSEFDIALSEYERYGETWSEYELHKFIKKWLVEAADEVVELRDELECVKSRCDDLDVVNYDLEQEVDRLESDVESLEKEIEDLNDEIKELKDE
jgi:chromosome segregation ATPase